MTYNHDGNARQYSDQMVCSRCGLVWDVNDPEPPECVLPESHGVEEVPHQPPARVRAKIAAAEGFRRLREMLAKAGDK